MRTKKAKLGGTAGDLSAFVHTRRDLDMHAGPEGAECGVDLGRSLAKV